MSQNILKKFGRTIKKLRSSLNISQEAFANQIELHRTYIGMIERGEKNISLNNIEKIAAGLHMTISDIFKEMEELDL